MRKTFRKSYRPMDICHLNNTFKRPVRRLGESEGLLPKVFGVNEGFNFW